MFSQLIVFVLALSAASAAVVPDYSSQRDEFNLRAFINRCSYSAADINKCFVENGNIAIRELATGFEELGFVSLDGFDIGDVFFSLQEDVSFLLENVKSYVQGPKLEGANLVFDEEGIFRSLVMTYSLTDYYWEGQYKAIGHYNNNKINEKGNFRINFGPFNGNYTAEFKQKEIEGEIYLKVSQHGGTKTYDHFEFVPSDVSFEGVQLAAEQFQQLQQPIIDKAIEARLNYITFVLNQILLEIPQNELFLA